MTGTRVTILAGSPSPHQVDFLSALVNTPLDASVGFLTPENTRRRWGAPTPAIPWSSVPTSLLGIVTGKLDSWLRAQNASVFVMSSSYSHPVTHYLCWRIRRLRVPYILIAEPPRPRSGWRGALRNRIMLNVLAGASGVLATGRRAAEIYRALELDLPVFSLPYFIELSRNNDPAQRTIESKSVRFVCVSQLIERKGIDVLLRACAILPSDGWSLDIYGSGPLKAKLSERARELKANIRFLGEVGYDERMSMYGSADVFVFPTRWDGWGMVVPEALAMGIPVIGSDQAMSVHEFVRDGKNGFVFTSEDTSGLAAAMNRFINRPEMADDMRPECTKSVADYSPEMGAKRFTHAILEIVADNQCAQ